MSENKPTEEGSAYPDVIIQGHNYDGITEYNNPMPGWWVWLFYATIAWSVFYAAALGLDLMDGRDQQLAKDQQYVAELRSSVDQGESIEVTEEVLAEFLDDSEQQAAGERTFMTRCASCHGVEGEGGIGPAFRADLDESERTPFERFEIVRDGIAEGGMPAHENLMSASDMAAVVAFIESL